MGALSVSCNLNKWLILTRASANMYNRRMDDHDKCMAFGHVPVLTRDYRREYKNGKIITSKHRVRMYICKRCGAQDV